MFFYYFCMMIEGIGSVSISDQWIRIREAQKHMDPTDPDPQHFVPTADSSKKSLLEKSWRLCKHVSADFWKFCNRNGEQQEATEIKNLRWGGGRVKVDKGVSHKIR
jgi:hypothetical protein